MSDIALRFIIANLAASAAILIVLALRRPIRAAFGARVAYALWLLAPLAAIGSMIPPRVVEIVRPAIGLPAPDLVPAFPPISAVAEVAPWLAPTPVSALDPAISPSPLFSLDPWAIGVAVWLIGVIATAFWLGRNQSRFMADARAGFAGPAVVGLLKPRIITPSDFEERFDRPERDVILAHETMHLTRNDARINATVSLVRCLAWFNPLVHIAAHVMRIDQELACDAAVVARHPRAKAVYASALLKAQLAARPLPLGCYWPAGEDHPLTERIEMLKRTAPGRTRRLAGAGAIAVLAAAAGAAAWAALPPQERFVNAPLAAEVTPTPAPQQTSPQPADPQQQPAPAPQQLRPAAQMPPVAPFAFRAASAGFYVTGEPVKLDRDAPILLRGKVEAIDFGKTSYVLRVRATSVSRDNRRDTEYAEPNTSLWELSPTNYFGDPDSIRADLMGRDIEVQGLNLNAACKPDCKIKVKQLYTPLSSEAPALQPGDSLIAAFTGWYDTSSRVTVLGKVERIEFADRTFDAYVRTEARGALPSQLFQTRFEYRYPRADIERELTGKTVQVSGWPARATIATHCTPVCGMFGDSIMVRLSPTQAMLVAPAGPTLAMSIPVGPRFGCAPPGVLQGICVTADNPAAAAPAAVQQPNMLRIVALKRERLEISSRDAAKFVDRYFEPGEEYVVGGAYAGDWTVSTPDGSAFEWRAGDASFGPIGAGPVRTQSITTLSQRAALAAQPRSQPAAPSTPPPQSSPQDAAPAKPQPTRYEPQQTPPRAPPPDIVAFASLFDADDPIWVQGTVTKVDLSQAYPLVWVQASAVGKRSLQPNTGAFRAMLSRTVPDWVNASLVGKEVTVRGYRAKDKTCTDSCLINGRDIILGGPVDISADHVSYDEANQITTFEDKVAVRIGGVRVLAADRMTVQGLGDPAKLQTSPPQWSFRAESMREDAQAGTITLEGNAEARYGDMVFKGDRLVATPPRTAVTAPTPN